MLSIVKKHRNIVVFIRRIFICIISWRQEEFWFSKIYVT